MGKTYPGTKVPAVEDLTLDVHEGEILVLVGPSGCGKSTTLRLINRMIEPTSGRIIFDGEDVTDVNPDKLRRRIGYVIQQIGLFPHQTIAQNIATVPKMLGWDKKRTAERVEELLDTVGLPAAEFRDRYPKELSGGQAQRAGVARALGADPAVMLMDEPFGAIDPITRDRLQNEFLRLQEELHKTIVFVTHDIDEAIKMGDRIAILGERSTIRQIDTPERILAYPVDDFVDDFIGAGSTLKGLNFERVSRWSSPTIRRSQTATPGEGLASVSTRPRRSGSCCSTTSRPTRWLRTATCSRPDVAALRRPGQTCGAWWRPTPPCTTPSRRCCSPRPAPAAWWTAQGRLRRRGRDVSPHRGHPPRLQCEAQGRTTKRWRRW